VDDLMALHVSLILLSLVIFASITSGQAQEVSAAKADPLTWNVLVGGEAGLEPQEYGLAGAWQFMRFYPENVTINVGDKIVWELASTEMHTVTFPAVGDEVPPLLIPEGNGSQRMLFNTLVVRPQGGSIYDGRTLAGSGQLDVEPGFPREYNLTFAKPGTFDYFCAFHNMMKGKIVVQPAGSPYPYTQEQIDAEATRLLAADMESALQAEPKIQNISPRRGANGTTIWGVKLGYGNGQMSWMRFIPENLTIHAGDTIEWIRGEAETPHTVTFLSGSDEPELVLVEPQQNGQPKLVLNPIVWLPAGNKVYSGEGYFNSGFIWGKMVPMPGPANYTLSFDTPGTYDYLCVLHDFMGMKGRITVLPVT
jgi:plastocyanin